MVLVKDSHCRRRYELGGALPTTTTFNICGVLGGEATYTSSMAVKIQDDKQNDWPLKSDAFNEIMFKSYFHALVRQSK